ncbi:hypothetical protein UA08_05018 [Talaromyces atroroseus]|uniref:Carrier domain-containing protein n=1 Tax=Talaromyces atroroseus TaxID=1441469 RepID=A0A225B1K1_TALAT|nr:hypothetical protein UA08_05018 [Talaromyces atroroseus]OKL59687.1 hypothetical protein UA08_05018 [Talaromyces atroroseus]
MVAYQLPEPIAVVGSGCRFPGSSRSPSSLWKLLERPRDVSREIPEDRFELKGYYHPKGSHHGTTNVVRAYMFDEDPRVFDANFFNISANEADSIDPQQRLLMEVVYEALEAGGHPIEMLRGSDTAVYVGTMSVDYNDIVLRDIESAPTYFATGSSRAILSNRISYFFDWHGPSMTIDTACSSSMVALHQGVHSLRSGESRVAVAGGTGLLLGPEQFVGESKMNLLSPDGRSRMWDANANGYARGDGIAAIVLKKLSDAIADGDRIECLIRETGVNQDGKSTGLTVPSPEAQAALIRETYARAGLDISNPVDWPQFFEAHGTGTKAGDPREASAIYQCFGHEQNNGNPLYVGSIKTIIGHTEGTAGLAGVIKASLAIQNGVIPPNMLLERLNPDIEPYYDHLRVPTSALPWPKLPKGVPRRASVNSFGFGGTNGHAIVESYEPSVAIPLSKSQDAKTVPFTPFTFSAVTEESLVALMESYSKFLKENDTTNLCDLAWTLQYRRSALASKASFSASTVEGLISKIDAKLSHIKETPGTTIGVRSNPAKPKILGVFTGQGAQWASMGAHLIRSSEAAREKLEQLDHSLATLPEADRPSWRIAAELSAAKDASRLSEAALSQPLCTAIQIVLVDLLRSAGITFSAVVGHSSGEIAASYAAGFISAHDAIRIAYYRGVHAKLAGGKQGQKGAMLAVGTSWEDAEELINLPVFKGRVKIAAHNSDASLTLSGDADKLAHAKLVFDEEKKFARMLHVDTAYHSHHMLPCSNAYMSSLKVCGIEVNRERHNSSSSCSWYSSVKSGQLMDAVDELRDSYWRDNMVNTVLFADAVKSAAADESLNMVIEVGPHPALKGPAQQTMSDLRSPLPYTGVLSRGSNDVEAFADALGFVWTYLGAGAVEFQTYDRLVAPGPSPKLATGLPSYNWNHKRVHWHESRLAKKTRLRGAPFHELLGVPSANSTSGDLRWRNFLKSDEIAWLDGHQLQGQTVFPAAGYVAMALEASKKLAGDKSVQVIEVRDLVIGKAITFDDGAKFAAETLVTLTGITSSTRSKIADFSVYSCPNTGSMDMELVSKGKVVIILGAPSFDTLSSTPLDTSTMTDIESDTFYSALDELGYGYNGPFRTLSNTKRKLGVASAFASTYTYGDEDEPLIVHPTMLDVAFQATFLAASAPGDDQLWSLHVPTSIKCIRVNPELCASLPISSVDLPLSVVLHEPESISVRSSIDIFSQDGQQTLLQVEDLVLKPFSPATAADDRHLYSMTRYDVASPNANIITGNEHPTAEDFDIASLCERLAYFYLRKWKSEIPPEQWESDRKHVQALRDLLSQLISTIHSGRHPTVKKEWNNDDVEKIASLINLYPDNIDLKMISIVGEAIPAVVRGEYSILDCMQKDNMLDNLYRNGQGFAQYNSFLARTMKQVAHRYPQVNILEIGGRTGHATTSILEHLGYTFASYTFTDVSTEAIQKAAELFKAQSQKVSYKVFDSDKTPASQEFKEYSYDVVIVSNILHSTSTPNKTLENVRRLLKPGGYLLMSGITDTSSLRSQVIMGGLSDWRINIDEDRKKAASRTAIWHNALRKTGFSGVDSNTTEVGGLAWPHSVITTQAVNDRVSLLRSPMSNSQPLKLEELVILGNGSLKSSRLAEEIAEQARKFYEKITILESLPTDDDQISPMTTFINLADLDEPIFKDLTEEKLEGLKCLFELSNNVIWVTEGARSDEPYHTASLGFGRSIGYEMQHLFLQFIDLDTVDYATPRLIIEAVLRLAAMDKWDSKGTLHDELLWTKEPEFYVEAGQVLVPRIVHNEELNGRINSLRRNVTKSVNPQSSTVYVSRAADTSIVLREELITASVAHGNDSIQLSHSVLSSLNVAPDTFLFLGLGTKQSTNETVIALSDIVASKISSATSLTVNIPPNQASSFLAAVASELLASSLVTKLSADSHILVNEPGRDEFFSSALLRQAAAKNIRVTFSTSKSHTKDTAWIRLTPWTSKHILQKWIPSDITHFLDLAADNDSKDAALQIRDCLPYTCRQMNVAELIRHQALIPRSNNSDSIKALEEAVNRAKKSASDKIPEAIVSAMNLSDASIPVLPLNVIDWTSDNALTVQVQPLNASRMFSRDKTYLLAGLSGDLGLSICEWMAKNGAGYVCLTSRRPKSDEKWVAAMKKYGTTVKFYAMDITKQSDLERVVEEIRETCPPIAGVANGAAVFHDGPFSEMSLEVMEKVTKPKVDGTNHLDAIFNDKDLEWFIVFSSIASVNGNSGQSNYSAANAYMTGLVSQRRKRGLAGTSIDIGRVAGIGYVERAGPKAKEQLIRFGCMAVSESDLHHLLAEAIHAGSPGSNAAPVITTGCRTVDYDEEPRVTWFNNPRFSHKIVISESSSGSRDGSKKSALPVREQLASATTKEEALEIMKDCFAAKLAMISQSDGEVGHDIPLVELGIDSLVAVEVRSWFLKELKTDMPVLKVLGGGSVADLCEQALEKMPEDLLPSLGKGQPVEAKAAEPSTAHKPTAPQSKSSTSISTGSSSGTRSPMDTPASQLSESPLDLADDLNKRLTSQRVEAQAHPSYTKSELVSFAQSRFWFMRLLIDDQTTYNIAIRIRIVGNLRVGDLERAVRLVGARHESLRTCFVADEKEADLAYQKVMSTSRLRLERKDISSVAEVEAEYEDMKVAKYNIETGDMMRLVLLTLSPTEHFLIVGYHHILMDGVSFQVFLSDLEKAYQRQSLGTPPCQLPEFSRSQRAGFENGEMAQDIQYWQREFKSGYPVLPLLPMAKVTSRAPVKVFDFNQVVYRPAPELSERIREISKALRSTTFHFYLATFKAMLFRFTHAEELTIGIADANRTSSDVMGTIGMLLNLLSLRFKNIPHQKFQDSVTEARSKAYEALNHSKVPFDVLLNELNVPRSSSYSPFFQAFFDYRQGQQETRSFGNTEFEFLDLHPGRTAYDITLDVTESSDKVGMLFRTQSSLYDMTATQLLIDSYAQLLEAFAGNTSLEILEPMLFSDKTLEHALEVGRGPHLESAWPETLPLRIDQVAEANKDRVALMDDHGRVLTYEAMTDRIEAIAEVLQDSGIGENSRVLVFEDATVDWFCSMLAIMRIGAVYIPLDLRNPISRLADVAESCQPAAILVDTTTVRDAPQLNTVNAKIINVPTVGSKPSVRVPNISKASGIAAILFTSGSTGKPKGIVVKHSGLRNEIEGYTMRWGLKAERVLQQSAFTFNHASDQVYTGLVNGGSVYIVPWSKRGDPIEITKIIREQGITYTKATPAEYSLWLDYGNSNLKMASAWRFAFGGGETLTSVLLEKIAMLELPNLRFFNSYGPTEISISSTKMELDYRKGLPEGRIPCGYSLPNYAAYILDEQLKPVPVGMPGELWIGGAGVSLGYLNNRELTDHHFVHNPYATPEYLAQGWTTMYRTGDIAHLQEDGAMVFHSRVAGDSQVKIRGLRIELSDIEMNILKAANGALREAIVTLRDGDPALLVAHVVFAPQHTVADIGIFLQHLLDTLELPQYMIPAMAIPLDKMPLSNHSKVDREALKKLPLPKHNTRKTNSNSEEILTETMVQLRRLWEDVLGAKEHGLDITASTSFFSIGGNSLLIVRLQSRIRAFFNVTLRLVDLLGANKLSEMAQLIEDSSNVSLIDWQDEVTLPETGPFSDAVTSKPIKTTDKVVLVTGAGGFLGKHILTQLVADPNVSKIHCIGLRDKPAGEPRKLAVSSPKIITHSGDLSEPWLGLSESHFLTLSADVDSILHMAAVRSFWDNYNLLRPVNVTPTKQLIKMAAARRIPIHYVSTAGVVPGQSAGSIAESVVQFPPPADGSQGYISSRWVSEQVLEKAALVLKVPTSIHRFVPSKTPSAEAAAHALEEFLVFIDKMSLMPELTGLTGRFDMTAVGKASGSLTERIAEESAQKPGAASFFHHECEIRIDIPELKAFVEERRGNRNFSTMPGLKFIGRMKELGLQYFVASQDLLMGSQTQGSELLESRR